MNHPISTYLLVYGSLLLLSGLASVDKLCIACVVGMHPIDTDRNIRWHSNRSHLLHFGAAVLICLNLPARGEGRVCL